ncbi:GNAT family N-acetyltransferase [Chitinimonas sp. BJYL2]|uniref:GNAT family N-acetyltransferase n=1 Tax=Chitinimonas sp. BJYL2 TaxID=2976696 RepID=UPI0022B3E822|nr:GNAT family N-acetyltransferase [Chitinimonas sp. BJYL2]
MKNLQTTRLLIRRLTLADAGFMLALLNTPSWLQFIGDRGVRTLADAERYIAQGPMAQYASLGFGFCAVESTASGEVMGICGLTQRDYLDAPDIGFAFLDDYCGKGYGYEAAAAVLEHAWRELGLTRILATTRLDNLNSQKLLVKLGLRFNRVIPHPDGNRELMLYTIDKPAH